ncbi:MAG TPA: hypothetical protein VGM27_04075 [Acidobacteriaceae bacterium]
MEPTDLKLAGKVALITGILAFDKGLGPDPRNELHRCEQGYAQRFVFTVLATILLASGRGRS